MVGGHHVQGSVGDAAPERFDLVPVADRREAPDVRAATQMVLLFEEQVVGAGLGGGADAVEARLSDGTHPVGDADVHDVHGSAGHLRPVQGAVDGLELLLLGVGFGESGAVESTGGHQAVWTKNPRSRPWPGHNRRHS